MTQAYVDALRQVLKDGGILAAEDETDQNGEREFVTIQDWDFMSLQEAISISEGRAVSWDEVMENTCNADGRSLAEVTEDPGANRSYRAQHMPDAEMTQEFDVLRQVLLDGGILADLGETNEHSERVLTQVLPWRWDDPQELLSVQLGRLVGWDEVMNTLSVNGRTLAEIHEEYRRDKELGFPV